MLGLQLHATAHRLTQFFVLCVCMCVRRDGLVCMRACAKAVGRSGGQPQIIPQVLSPLFFEASLLLTWVSSMRLGWLARELQGPFCLCFPAVGLLVCATTLGFLRHFRDLTQVPILAKQAFDQLSFLPSPQFISFRWVLGLCRFQPRRSLRIPCQDQPLNSQEKLMGVHLFFWEDS